MEIDYIHQRENFNWMENDLSGKAHIYPSKKLMMK